MASKIIVSYDGTPNDDDALALGKLLAHGGAEVALAYVRHSREFDPRREELAQHDAERRLEQGAELLGGPAIARHVILSPSTGQGLTALAASENATIIVFGSDYRTTPGAVEPGQTAQYLLEGGPVAIAVAPAGLRTKAGGRIRSIRTLSFDGDTTAARTAEAFAANLGAEIVSAADPPPDLIVVGSQPAAREGTIALSGAVRSALDSARSSVLVVPSRKPVSL